MLNASYIKEFSLIRKAEDPLDLNACFLDLNTLLAREDSAIRYFCMLQLNSLNSFAMLDELIGGNVADKLRWKPRGSASV